MAYTQKEMEQLYVFMQADVRADKVSDRIKHSELRQKLEKKRDMILRQQQLYRQIDEQSAACKDRMDILSEALGRCSDQLAALQARMDQEPLDDEESINSLMAEADKLQKSVIGYERELRDIQKQIQQFTSRLPDIQLNIARGKADFDAMRKEYTAETETLRAQEKTLRGEAASLTGGIPQELMDTYQAVKRQISPPIARLSGAMCTGCNTSQPNASIRRIEEGNIVECETCGRILMLGQ